MKNVGVVILAGGSGSRLRAEQPKQLVKVAGKAIVVHAIDCFRVALPEVPIVVVLPNDHTEVVGGYHGVTAVVGGCSRQESSFRGLKFLKEHFNTDLVLIHDACRPFLDAQIIFDVIDELKKYSAVDVAIPTTDTVVIEREGVIDSIPSRRNVYRGQTPQGFKLDRLLLAYQRIGGNRLKEFFDDCGVFIEAFPDEPIKIVEGSIDNIKVTHPIDLTLADELFRLRQTNANGATAIDVKGKRALVFGGTRGIGEAIVTVLKSEGCAVEAVSRSTGCDVGSYDSVKNAIEEARANLKGIDYVVNCAGTLIKKPLAEQSENDISETINTNFLGAINISRASKGVLSHSKGMLIHISSSSYTRGRADYVIYSASKAAIVNLTQGLAEEWLDDGIRVNCLVPGRTKTQMRRDAFGDESLVGLTNPYVVAVAACQVASSNSTGLISRV